MTKLLRDDEALVSDLGAIMKAAEHAGVVTIGGGVVAGRDVRVQEGGLVAGHDIYQQFGAQSDTEAQLEMWRESDPPARLLGGVLGLFICMVGLGLSFWTVIGVGNSSADFTLAGVGIGLFFIGFVMAMIGGVMPGLTGTSRRSRGPSARGRSSRSVYRAHGPLRR